MSSIDRPRRPGTALALPGIHPEKDPLRQYLASLPSPRSKAAVRSALKRAARELAVLDGLDEIDVAEVTAESYQWGAPGALSFGRVNLAVAKIAATHRPAARLALNALRGVARASLDLGLLGHEDLLRILHVKPPRLSGSQRGRALPGDEVTALYSACAMDPSPRGRRDAALIAILRGLGRSLSLDSSGGNKARRTRRAAEEIDHDEAHTEGNSADPDHSSGPRVGPSARRRGALQPRRPRAGPL